MSLNRNRNYAPSIWIGVILFLLSSQAFSLLYPVLGFYFPNEKLALILAIFLIATKGIKFDSGLFRISVLVVGLLLISVLGRLLIFGDVSQADLNYMIFPFSWLFYVACLSRNINAVYYYVPYVTLINIVISIIQLILLFGGYQEYAGIFSNYGVQSGYEFPINFFGFPRTTGLAPESSQFSALLVIYIIFYTQGFISKSKLNKWINIAALIEIVLNASLTSYIVLFVYYSAYFYYVIIGSGGKTGFVPKITFAFLFIVACFILGPWIIGTLIANFNDTSQTVYPRLYGLIFNVIHVYETSPLIGLGLTADKDVLSWDFLSVNFYGFGMLGLVAIIIVSSFIFRRSSWPLIILYFLFIISNGTFSASTNLLILTLAVLMPRSSPGLDCPRIRRV